MAGKIVQSDSSLRFSLPDVTGAWSKQETNYCLSMCHVSFQSQAQLSLMLCFPQTFQSLSVSFTAAVDHVDWCLGSKYINHMMPSPNTETQASPETEEDTNSSSSSAEINVILRSSAGSRSSHSMDESPSRLSVDRSRSPGRVTPNSKTVACMTDIGSLVRRVKNVRVVYTPETCV